ncbi:hypothetical protein AHAS_Ahas07G0128800 [Arachis hypogaea]
MTMMLTLMLMEVQNSQIERQRLWSWPWPKPKGRPRLFTGCSRNLHAGPYTLVESSTGVTVSTSGRPPPIATTTPSRQESQIPMMPTLSAPRSCAQQANEPPNTASHGV